MLLQEVAAGGCVCVRAGPRQDGEGGAAVSHVRAGSAAAAGVCGGETAGVWSPGQRCLPIQTGQGKEKTKT